HERVALVPGVLAGGVGQLPGQAVLHPLELVVVGGGEADGEGVGHVGPAPHPDGAVVVHLPHQPAAELDGTEAALEGPCEGAFDHALEPPFEPSDTHRRRGYPVRAGRTEAPAAAWGVRRAGRYA